MVAFFSDYCLTGTKYLAWSQTYRAETVILTSHVGEFQFAVQLTVRGLQHWQGLQDQKQTGDIGTPEIRCLRCSEARKQTKWPNLSKFGSFAFVGTTRKHQYHPISDNVSTINSNHIVNQCKSDRLLMIVCRESAIGLGYGSCGAKVREQFEYCLNMISCLVNSCVLCFFQSTASISVRSFRQGQISAGSVGVISCSRWGVFLDAIGERCRWCDEDFLGRASANSIWFWRQDDSRTYLQHHISSVTDSVPRIIFLLPRSFFSP